MKSKLKNQLEYMVMDPSQLWPEEEWDQAGHDATDENIVDLFVYVPADPQLIIIMVECIL